MKNCKKWCLIIALIIIHVFIICGCMFGDRVYQYYINSADKPKGNKYKIHGRKREDPCTEHYFCIEDKALPYALAFLIVFLTILLLGLAKGLIGLICSRRIGMFGLDLLLDLPHPICYYYEPELRNEEVIYDELGWPIHPVTCQRVRVINESSELCINSVFFFAFPFFVIWVAIQNAFSCYENVHIQTCSPPQSKEPLCQNHYKSSSPSPRGYHQKSEHPRLFECKNSKCPVRLYSGKGVSCKRLDTYKDEDDTAEEKDTQYVLEQLTKSEEKLNSYQIVCERDSAHFSK